MKLRAANASFANATETELTTPRARRIRRFGWWIFFLAGLSIFTVIKFPKERISEWLVGMVNDQLRASGLTLTSQRSDITFGFGITLKLYDAKLNAIGSSSGVVFEEFSFTPSLISTATGSPGGSLELKSGNGKAQLDFSMQSITPQNTSGKIQFDVKNLDLKKTGVFPFLLSSFFPRFPGSENMFQFQGGGMLEGEGNIDGNFAAMNSLQGTIKMNMKNVHVEEKSLFGFRIPNLNISAIKLDVSIIKGKATIRALDVGGQANDDLTAKLNGEVLLGKEMAGSSTNLKAKFSLSQGVKDAIGVFLQNIDHLKKPDGSYAAILSGTWGSLVPTPDPNP